MADKSIISAFDSFRTGVAKLGEKHSRVDILLTRDIEKLYKQAIPEDQKRELYIIEETDAPNAVAIKSDYQRVLRINTYLNDLLQNKPFEPEKLLRLNTKLNATPLELILNGRAIIEELARRYGDAHPESTKKALQVLEAVHPLAQKVQEAVLAARTPTPDATDPALKTPEPKREK